MSIIFPITGSGWRVPEETRVGRIDRTVIKSEGKSMKKRGANLFFIIDALTIIDGKPSGANDQEKDQSADHAKIDPGLMHGIPESVLHQERIFRCINSH